MRLLSLTNLFFLTHLLASSNINASYSLQEQDLLCQNTQTLYFSNEVVNKLASIHKSYATENMCDELPEQLFHTAFVKKGDKVLELGANIGRSTLVLAKQVSQTGAVYASESQQDIRQQLEAILSRNKVDKIVKIFPAFSKKSLIAKSWNTKYWDRKKQLPSGWKYVATAQLPKDKYNVLVADCEGCLLPMLNEFPDMLDSVNKIIIENDATTATTTALRKKIMDKGFTSKRCIPINIGNNVVLDVGGNFKFKGPYSLYRLFYNEVPHVKTCFYEYWEKNES